MMLGLVFAVTRIICYVFLTFAFAVEVGIRGATNPVRTIAAALTFFFGTSATLLLFVLFTTEPILTIRDIITTPIAIITAGLVLKEFIKAIKARAHGNQ